MRLLHVTATHLHMAGGIPVVLRELVCAQNKILNFQARVLSLKASVEEVCSEYFDKTSIYDFASYVDVFCPDVVIFHSFFYLEYILAGNICTQKNIPYFIEPHGSFGKAALHKSAFKKLIVNYSIFWKLRKNAKGMIFLNDAEKKDSLYRTKNDIVVPNGINVNYVNDTILYKETSFYYVGRYDITHKGLDILLEALKILDEKKCQINFHFFGMGDRNSTDYVNARLESLKSIKAHNYGPIYGDEQRVHLEQLGPMVLTSRYEGFPMTILEAWAYGNPCVVTPGTNTSDEIEINNLGWVTDLVPTAVAMAIEKAHNEYKERRIQYILDCKKYVTAHYDWKNIATISYDNLCRNIGI